MSKTILITGANRGIGLEFTRQYSQDPQWNIIACCRQPDQATDLQALCHPQSNIRVLPLDINHADSIAALHQQLATTPIDCLINNAGRYGEKGEAISNISSQNMMETFQTNVCGTLLVCQSFIDLIANSQEKLIITISSKMGSISDNASGKAYTYRASKSALNAVMKSLAIDLAPQKIRVLILHPGWVQTDMGGNNALLTVTESVCAMRELIVNQSAGKVANSITMMATHSLGKRQ